MGATINIKQQQDHRLRMVSRQSQWGRGWLKSNLLVKVSKGARIRNGYNQVPYLIHDTNGKVTNLQLDTENENQEVSPSQAAYHKAQINRRTQRHNKIQDGKSINDPQKK